MSQGDANAILVLAWACTYSVYAECYPAFERLTIAHCLRPPAYIIGAILWLTEFLNVLLF